MDKIKLLKNVKSFVEFFLLYDYLFFSWILPNRSGIPHQPEWTLRHVLWDRGQEGGEAFQGHPHAALHPGQVQDQGQSDNNHSTNLCSVGIRRYFLKYLYNNPCSVGIKWYFLKYLYKHPCSVGITRYFLHYLYKILVVWV